MINKQDKLLKAAIIGLGNQTFNDHIPSLLRRNDVIISVVCDVKKQALDFFCDKYSELSRNVKKYTNFEKIPLSDIDFVIVSLPHDEYFEIIKILVANGIPFVKEKPFARNIEEMKKILSLPGIEKCCFVCSQRRYSSLYVEARKVIRQVGKPYLFSACYKLKIQDPHKGWRGNSLKAGGGCLIDMGYHIIDQLLWWFGEPEKIFVSKSNLAVPKVKEYAEDTSLISFKYSNGLHGSIILSRSTAEKKEEYELVGSKAQINGDKKSLVLRDKKGNVLLNLSIDESSEMIDNQLDFFIKRIRGKRCFSDILSQHKKNMEFIDRCYKVASS
ncbi:MAG: Gfo/Idh/MocA family oxidoreductase [Patescibacteria group bacterium]|nr:Gfo/Idh/MocA family oxidoreductase [Patescibacteria group bacterium]